MTANNLLLSQSREFTFETCADWQGRKCWLASTSVKLLHVHSSNFSTMDDLQEAEKLKNAEAAVMAMDEPHFRRVRQATYQKNYRSRKVEQSSDWYRTVASESEHMSLCLWCLKHDTDQLDTIAVSTPLCQSHISCWETMCLVMYPVFGLHCCSLKIVNITLNVLCSKSMTYWRWKTVWCSYTALLLCADLTRGLKAASIFFIYWEPKPDRALQRHSYNYSSAVCFIWFQMTKEKMTAQNTAWFGHLHFEGPIGFDAFQQTKSIHAE